MSSPTTPRAASVSAALLAIVLFVGSGCGGGSGYHGPHGKQDLVDCPPIDLVFIVDTSGSMEDEATALCNQMAQVQSDLEARGATFASILFLGIDEPAPGQTLLGFECLPDNVANRYGATVPGAPPPAIGTIQDDEDWGPATAVVTGNHPWAPGALRLIVPISDEGAYDGDPCEDPGDDRDSVEHAIALAQAEGVIVSPIAATGSDACVIALQSELASRTGGRAFVSTDPATEMSSFILQLIEDACTER